MGSWQTMSTHMAQALWSYRANHLHPLHTTSAPAHTNTHGRTCAYTNMQWHRRRPPFPPRARTLYDGDRNKGKNLTSPPRTNSKALCSVTTQRVLSGVFHVGARNPFCRYMPIYYCTMQNTDKQSQHSWKLLCGAWLSTECHAPPGSAWQRGAVSPPAILLGSAVSTHVENSSLKIVKTETSLAAHWLRLCTSNAGGVGLIPGWGTKIPHAHMPHGTAKINK